VPLPHRADERDRADRLSPVAPSNAHLERLRPARFHEWNGRLDAPTELRAGHGSALRREWLAIQDEIEVARPARDRRHHRHPHRVADADDVPGAQLRPSFGTLELETRLETHREGDAAHAPRPVPSPDLD